MTELSIRLKAARGAAGYQTGSDAARAFGWPVSTYLGHENGDRRPSLKTIEKYARSFRVDPSYIAYGKDEDFKFKPNKRSLIPILGYIKDNGTVLSAESHLEMIEYFELNLELPGKPFALIIETNQLKPRFSQNDLLVLVGGITDPSKLVGNYCFCKATNGRQYFAQILLNGASGMPTLYFDDFKSVIQTEVEVDEYAMIVFVILGQNLQKTSYNDFDVRILSVLGSARRKRGSEA